MGVQPALPSPVPFTDIEQTYIDETPPSLFPENQDSNFGLHRKIFCDILTDVEDQVQTLYNERWASTATSGYLDYHEFQVGLPVNPSGYSIERRRSYIAIRNLRGPFTTGLLDTIVSFFIIATFGTPPTFGLGGIIIDGGIPLYAPSGDVSSLFRIVADIPNYKYAVWIDNSITVNFGDLVRELTRVTPAGIIFSIATMYQETGGGNTKLKGGGPESH